MKQSKALSFILKLILTVFFFFIILRKIDVQQIYATFTSPAPTFLFISTFLCIPNFALKFYKWQFLLKSCKIKADIWVSSKSYLVGLFFGLVTPARAGEIGRVLFLNGQDKLKAAGAVIIDKIVDLIGILLFSLIGARIFLARSIFFTDWKSLV